MSMFLDQVTIDVKAGKGGDGMVASVEKNMYQTGVPLVVMAVAVATLF